MRECIILGTNIVLVAANIIIIVLWFLSFRRVGELQKKENKHFIISQIDFELAVQEQKRNQSESDVTQLRIKKAELLLMSCTQRKEGEWGKAMKEIEERLKQYKECRTPKTEKRIKELKKKKEKYEDCGK